MPNRQVDACMEVERVTVADSDTWASLATGGSPDAVRGDLFIRVCDVEVRIPDVVLGHDCSRGARIGLVSLLVGVVEEVEEIGIQAGQRSHVVKLGGGRLLEAFILDESHVYLALRSNAGGSFQLEMSARWLDLVEVGARIVGGIREILDGRPAGQDGHDHRSRIIGSWESLRERSRALDGHLTVVRETDDPLADA